MVGHAIITGGSSGIGLAAAKNLAARGCNISLLARGPDGLSKAAEAIRQSSPVQVSCYPVDVSDAEACREAVATAVAKQGLPDWAISSAGIVRPGKFCDQTPADHRAQIDTNYMGSVNFAYAVYPHMKQAGGGKLVLISSGAALVGLYGYSSYGPTKFALRGLAESLRVELKGDGISVTLVFPGDTDTPQLAGELPARPAVTSKLAEGAHVMSPEAVAARFIKAADAGQFVVTYGLQLHALHVLQGMIAPILRAYQTSLAKRLGHSK